MREYEEIVEDIRTVLASDVPPLETSLQSLDERYAQSVEDINRRLRECEGLLANGHRSEAIQKCESEPNLLDATAILDFPERELWVEYVRQFGRPGPLPILSDVAARLNEAYIEEMSLADLLRRHRLHALMRSPLPARIGALREIAARDSANPIWQEDLRSFEKVRHTQLQAATAEAVKQGDLKTLSTLEEEVQSDRWLEFPDAGLVQQIVDAHTRVRVAHGRQRLANLVDELTEAYSDFDVKRARELRALWKAQSAIAISENGDELAEMAAPALHWLEEQDRIEQEEGAFKATITQLERALDEWEPAEEIERISYKLRSFDREVPSTLNSRLRERLESLEVAARRKSRAVFVCVALTVLTLGALITWAMVARQKNQIVASHDTNMGTLLEANKLAESRDYLESIPAWVRRKPPLQRREQELSAAEEAERQRGLRLEQFLENARALENEWETYVEASGELDRAETEARTAEEQARVTEARRTLELNRRTMQQEYDDQFVIDLEAFREDCNRADPTDLQELQTLNERGSRLRNRDRVSVVFLNRVEPLLQALENRRQAESAARSRARLINNITSSVGDIDDYIRNLQAFATSFPQTRAAISFRNVAASDARLWRGMKAWDALLASWESQRSSLASANAASSLAATVKNVLEEYPGYPAAQHAAELVSYLEAIAARGDASVADLKERLRIEIIQVDAALVADGNDLKRFYFSPARDPSPAPPNRWGIWYYKNQNLNVEPKYVSQETVKNKLGADQEYIWDSPQKKFAKHAEKHLLELARQNWHTWESKFNRMINELHGDQEIEPILKYNLMLLLLQTASKGSYPFQVAFRASIRELENANVNQAANWIDPEDQDGRKASADASRVLSRIESPRKSAERALEVFLRMRSPIQARRYRWIGWLHRDSEGDWVCEMKDNGRIASSELFVVTFGAGRQGAELKKIGTLQGGAFQAATASSNLVAGSPVYVPLSSVPRQ